MRSLRHSEQEQSEEGRVSDSTPTVITPVLNFSALTTLAQLASQLKMDLSAVFKTPLFYIILALVVISTVGEYGRNISPLSNTPLYPFTSLMLGALRIQFELVLLIGIYYSAELVHRERACAIDGIVNASPFPDWLMIVSKILSLCLLITALLLVVILSSMGLQAAAGYTRFEPGLYLQSAFIYHGFYYFMLCILAVVIQTASPNKGLGMLLVLAVYILLLSLPALGFEHPLYSFSIPFAIHSDMNGFGYFRVGCVLADRLLGCLLRTADRGRASVLSARRIRHF